MDLPASIETKLFEINEILKNSISPSPNYGFLSGLSGKAFFLYHYALLYNNQNNASLPFNIDDIILSVSQYKGTSSFCSGISGVCYLLTYLEKRKKYGTPFNPEIDDYLNQVIMKNIAEHNYEFLYGLMGISNYMINYPGVYYKNLISIIDFLENTKEKAEKGYRWGKYSEKNKRYEYNLSLSHGMSSIIVILAKLYNIDTFKDQRKRISGLLTGTVEFILSQQQDAFRYGSYFPYVSVENGPDFLKSRLAWCYGDLGISIAVWQAGSALQRKDWTEKAEEILLFAANERRDLKSNLVIDACLCHGTAGITAVFYRMWWNTKNIAFKKAADYWIQKTLEFSIHQNGLAGFLSLSSSYTWWKCDNLLEGIAGIGLVLLYYLKDREPVWDECMLMS